MDEIAIEESCVYMHTNNSHECNHTFSATDDYPKKALFVVFFTFFRYVWRKATEIISRTTEVCEIVFDSLDVKRLTNYMRACWLHMGFELWHGWLYSTTQRTTMIREEKEKDKRMRD